MSASKSRDVSLTIPARPDYLVLARLALSAVCRLTPLAPEEVADLKLAITEAATDFVDNSNEEDRVISFEFRLLDEQLELELAGQTKVATADDQELSRAIINATVDRCTFEAGRTVLVKYLTRAV